MADEDPTPQLLDWFGRMARVLPWRGDADPYHVLVSEFLLQQTRMETALPRFRALVRRWPRVEDLAAASEDDVMAAWSGMGYYRRARNLHATARRIVEDHGGVVPKDVAALRALPGIGPYTAAAVASIAYGRPEPAVDGNVLRVVGRYLGLKGEAASAAFRRTVTDTVRAWVRRADAGLVNQALMDLGSRVCRPRSPDCPACPLAGGCLGLASGDPTSIPARVERPVRPEERLVAILASRGDRVLVEPTTGHGVLEGLWGPPLRRRRPAGGRALPEVRHVFTHKAWRVEPVVVDRPPSTRRSGRWVTRDEFVEMPASSLGRKLVTLAFQA